MADLVARVADLAHELGVGERGVARDEERRRHVVPLQQRQDPRHGHRTELAARHRRHVAERHLVRPGRERVEVEREADREPRRGHAASAATDCLEREAHALDLGCERHARLRRADRRPPRAGSAGAGSPQAGRPRRSRAGRCTSPRCRGTGRRSPRDTPGCRPPARPRRCAGAAASRSTRPARRARSGRPRAARRRCRVGEVEEVDRRALDRQPRRARARLRAGARASARSPRWPRARRPASARPRPAAPGRRPRDRRSRSRRALPRSARSGCARRPRSSGIRSGGGS